MAIQTKYPTLKPTLNLDFANSRTIDPRITFTRASSATYFDEKGVMRTALAGVPRIDHGPVTGECKGLLIEEQRTNLLTYSEQFNNAAWSKARATVTADAVVSPDGTVDADKLIVDTSFGTHYVTSASITTLASTAYTATVYAKAAEYTRVELMAIFGSVPYAKGFDLSTGLPMSTVLGGVTDAGSDATITHVGNGWYRCSITKTTDATLTCTHRVYLRSGGDVSITGDGTSGIYIWGAQHEVGSFPTSYIKTEASQVTRAADLPFMTGTNFSDWYRSDEGTFVLSYTKQALTSSVASLEISDGSVLNSMRSISGSTATQQRIDISAAGIMQAQFVLNSASAVNTKYNEVFAYKANDFAATQNAGTVQTDVSGAVPVVNKMLIGSSDINSPGVLNGSISRIAYYPKRLTNEQLQALTA